jgi:hypothetical protein
MFFAQTMLPEVLSFKAAMVGGVAAVGAGAAGLLYGD